jgi:hypothetical protein
LMTNRAPLVREVSGGLSLSLICSVRHIRSCLATSPSRLVWCAERSRVCVRSAWRRERRRRGWAVEREVVQDAKDR